MRSKPEAVAAAKRPPLGWIVQRAPLLLGILTLLGFALRLIALGGKSFWLDEIASIAICLRPGNSFWEWVWRHEGNMALYYVLLRPWLHLGLGEGTVRFVSVIPGVLTIPMMYLLGKRLFSAGTGLLAALMVAVSPCAVVYSQEARAYSLLVLAVAASTYLFVCLIEEPSIGMACGYGVAAALTLYCHYFGTLAIAAHFASLLALPRGRIPWKHLALAVLIIAILGAPVGWMIHIQDSAHLEWVAKPSLLELYHLGVFLAAETGKGAGPVLLALELVLIAIFLRRLAALANYRQSMEFWKYGLVASGLFTPVVISLLVSMVKPVFFHRFLIICLPAWLLMAAIGVELIGNLRLRTLAAAGVVVLSLVCVVVSYSRVREDWKGAVTFLISHARRDDRVLYYQPVAFFGTETYRDWLPGGHVERPKGVMAGGDEQELRREMDHAARIWLVRYPANLQDSQSRALETELLASYTPAGTTMFHAITIAEYVRKPTHED